MRGSSSGRAPRGHRRGRRDRAAPHALPRGPRRGRGRGRPAARAGWPFRGLAVQRGAQPPGACGAGRRPRLAGIRRPGELAAARAHRLGDGGQVGRGGRARGDRLLPPGRTAADDPGRLRHRGHLHGGEAQARRGDRPQPAELAGQPVGPGRGGGLAWPVRRLHRLPAPRAPGLRGVRHLRGRTEPGRECLPAVRHRLPYLPGRPRGAGRPARPRPGGALVRTRSDPAGRRPAA